MSEKSSDQDLISSENLKPLDTNLSFVLVHQDFGNIVANTIKKWCIDCLRITYPNSNIYDGDLTGPQHLFIGSRIQAYAQARREIRGNLVFLDTDIVALCPIPDIWSETFDIGLTKGSIDSEYNLQPFNGGMIFAQDTVGAQFFFDYIENVCLNTMGGVFINNWFVDQLAMGKAWDTQKAIINFKVFEKEYNYFPTQESDDGPAYFMHFKGDRKAFMHTFVNRVLNAST